MILRSRVFLWRKGQTAPLPTRRSLVGTSGISINRSVTYFCRCFERNKIPRTYSQENPVISFLWLGFCLGQCYNHSVYGKWDVRKYTFPAAFFKKRLFWLWFPLLTYSTVWSAQKKSDNYAGIEPVVLAPAAWDANALNTNHSSSCFLISHYTFPCSSFLFIIISHCNVIIAFEMFVQMRISVFY